MFLFLVFFFFFFFLSFSSLMRRWGGVGEWFVHDRVEHVCKEAEDAGLKHFTCFVKGRLINRVLETQFSSRRHVEKTSNQT